MHRRYRNTVAEWADAAVWLAVLAVLVCLLTAVKARGDVLADLFAASCRVRCGSGDTGSGCAFERSNGTVYVLTCAHVVEKATTATCEFYRNGQPLPGVAGHVVLRGAANGVDAAVIAIPDGPNLPATVVPCAGSPTSPETVVASVGCPAAGWPTGFVGRVTGGGSDLQFQPPPANGRSGSALVDVRSARIVGIVRARAITPSPNGLAVPMAAIRRQFAGQAKITLCRDYRAAILPLGGGPATNDPEPAQCPLPGCQPYSQPYRRPLAPVQPPPPSTPLPQWRTEPETPRLDPPSTERNHPTLAEIEARLKTLEANAKAPAQGPPGPEGPPGRDGARGKDADPAAVDASVSTHLAARLPPLLARITAAEQQAQAAPGIERVKEVSKEVAVGIVAEKAPKALDLFLPGLFAALGVSSPLAALGVWLAKRAATKLVGRVAARHFDGRSATTQPSSTRRIVVEGQGKQPIVIQDVNAPLPGTVTTEHTFVQVPQTTKRQRALEEALKKVVQKYPGTQEAVETIQSYATQIESGMTD
jgi:hypothetical protein